MAEGWFSAAELAAMQIASLPSTERSINRIALRDRWVSRERNKRGGGREYPVTALPAGARAELAKRQITAVPTVAQSDHHLATVPATAYLKDHQRKRMEARASILALVDHLVEIEGHTRAKAIEAVIERARLRSLPALLQSQIGIANARANEERTLARATVFNWLKARDAAGGAIAAFATKAAPEADMPVWAGTFMQLYARPSKPNLTEVLDGWPAGDVARPSYDQARRFLKRLDAVTRNKGRMGPRALKSLKAYIARDVSNLWPGAVFIGDGHTFKAEVAHPLHGRPFRPEVTAILDVYTRRWVGWSVALAEDTWSVADALRHAVTTTTCCDVFYYDNGAGAKNAAWDEPVTGFIARLSITKLHSAPWSSQARGVIERFNSSVFHKLARHLPTYVGQRMDKEARQSAFKVTRHDIAATGASKLLLGWPAFRDLLDAAQRLYNATPHSFLPRIVDAASGRRRHQAPDDAWETAVAAGWTAEPVTASEARDLFRPAVTRSVQRGVIKLFNNAYAHPALETLHGETVQVAFDLHDARAVVVRLMDGRFICEAEWNANSRDYIPVAFAERARDKRIEGKLRRLDAHRDGALAEATPNLRLIAGAAPEPAPLTARQQQIEAEIIASIDEPVAPVPLDADAEKDQRFRRALVLEQQVTAGAGLAETDAAWLARYVNTPEYRTRKMMFESFGDSFLSA